jgi:hypothetical protein
MVLAAGLLMPMVVRAQEPPMMKQEPPVVELSARTFGGREGKTYYGVSLEFLRGAGATKGASVKAGRATLLSGGRDFEIGGYLPSWHGVVPQVGVSMPDTAARPQGGLYTARLRYERGAFLVEPQAVLGRDTLVGIALGTRKTSGSLTLSGSITPIVSGKNSVSANTGRPNQTMLWEVGATRGNVTLGATNALGTTTGFGLSPAVSGVAILLKVRTVL